MSILTAPSLRELSLDEQITSLEELQNRLGALHHVYDKLEVLNQLPQVEGFLKETPPVRVFLAGLTPECDYAIKAILAIGQGSVVFRIPAELDDKFERLRLLLQELLVIEKFYGCIGGIIGYHLTVLRLINESAVVKPLQATSQDSNRSYLMPEGLDISKNTPEVHEAVASGIKSLADLAEIYPVGGAGDRLSLIDPLTDEPLPTARLEFSGKTLLEGLIRDLQGREYLHYKLFGKQVTVPVAMMTSTEKNNHQHVLDICKTADWFGRSEKSFYFFEQPLVPVITVDGDWVLKSSLQLVLKPGGHGVLWKLATERGALDWIAGQGRRKLLVRQINNPIAGTDNNLLAFCGLGSGNAAANETKIFGFASCQRRVNAAEGMNVLVEKKAALGYDYGTTCIEYTAFSKAGVEDTPVKPGSLYSQFPCNTNLLFADLAAIQSVVQPSNPQEGALAVFPGLLVNMKNIFSFIDPSGSVSKKQAGRLECTMQNIAEVFMERRCRLLKEGERGTLKTFLTYNTRRKTISVTKKSHAPGMPLIETPEGCFYEHLENCRELLVEHCRVDVPALGSQTQYMKGGPAYFFLYHPALGPLYSVIGQKIRGGKFYQGSELQLEISELNMENLSLKGSLLIETDLACGHLTKEQRLQYSEWSGKCSLRDVTVVNKGIDHTIDQGYWKNQLLREEALRIIIRGSGEFEAEGVTFIGKQTFVVPDGQLMIAFMENKELKTCLEPISQPTWYWHYVLSSDNKIVLERRHGQQL